MKNEELVIDKDYEFSAVADGFITDICLHVQCTHEEVMKLGEYFLDETSFDQLNDNEIDVKFRFKDELDEVEVENIANSLYEDWKDSHDEDYEDDEYDDMEKSVDDFYDIAWESLAEYYYYTWSPDFKQDCIDYYKNHIMI